MDLSSLNRGHPGAAPGAYDNQAVETRLEFDDTGRPYYVAVPVPARPGAIVPADPAGPTPGPEVTHPPAALYYAPAAVPYSPLRDPFIARLAVGGAVVVGGCVGLSFVLQALAAAETALGFVVGGLAVLWLMASGRGASSKDVNISITNHNTDRRRR